MRANFFNGLMFGTGILLVIVVGIAVAVAADILTVDKDGTIRLRVSDTGKVTLNTSETAQGDMRFTTRSADPTAPLAGDLWYNDAVKEIKYADGGITKPIASMTDAALALYVNGTTGDDNNNGLTSGAAVKTIQKAVNLVPPIVRHAVTINIAAGTYRDTGATIGTATANVYIAGNLVVPPGSITLRGSTTLAGASGYRVTGSDSGADTTPVRAVGFYVHSVRSVNIEGFLCDYFTSDGILYNIRSSGRPLNSICDNNLYGIRYAVFSNGSPTNCQLNTNTAYGLIVDTGSYSAPTSCTIGNNGSSGIIFAGSRGDPNNCSVSSNGWNGITYVTGAYGYPSNNTSASNNTGFGIYSTSGSMVDFTGTAPGGTSGATGEDTATYARIF